MDAAAAERLIPLFILFGLGMLARRRDFIGSEGGGKLLQFVFFVTLPLLVFSSLIDFELQREHIALPLLAMVIVAATYLPMRMLAQRFTDDPKIIGVSVVAAMIMNIGFSYPFILTAYGTSGLAIAVLFDAGNAALVFSLVYYIANRFGDAGNSRTAFQRLLTSPPLWGLMLALLFNSLGMSLPGNLSLPIEAVGSLTIPLVMIALGVCFQPRVLHAPLLLSTVAMRVMFGLLLGLIGVELCGIEGLARSVVLVCAASPVGSNTLTFAQIANLDTEYAASLVSVSIGIGLVVLPILILLV